MAQKSKPVVGLALGSGSARGWAHIGIIQALEELGIRPQVIAGTSVGALVGAIYAAGELEAFSDWVRELTPRDVFGLLDFSFSGGMVKGEKLFGFFQEKHLNPNIEDLEIRFASVATEMDTGREVWITKGPIMSAARASCSIPGLFSPVKFQDRWMLDGGLVNPVPVSTCRALGAEVIIAVNLNAQLVGRHFSAEGREQVEQEAGQEKVEGNLLQRFVRNLSSANNERPAIMDVMASSVNILQDRLTRSRMAGDPPEITLVPLLADFALMDFHRAQQAIEEGKRLVEENCKLLLAWAGVDRAPVAGGSELVAEEAESQKVESTRTDAETNNPSNDTEDDKP